MDKGLLHTLTNKYLSEDIAFEEIIIEAFNIGFKVGVEEGFLKVRESESIYAREIQEAFNIGFKVGVEEGFLKGRESESIYAREIQFAEPIIESRGE